MTSEQKVLEFEEAQSTTMDKTIRLMIEHMFDHDNDEGELHATINRGKENEAVVVLAIRIKSIDGNELRPELAEDK